MGNVKFSIIDQCLWEVPRNEIIMPESEEIRARNLRIKIPAYCVYIEHPVIGKILFDTGVSEDWENTWNPTIKSLYKIIYLNSLRNKLKELGTSPEEIDLLILSHMHYDHAGNVRLFSNTKAGKSILVSQAEAGTAFAKTDSGYDGPYQKEEFRNLPGIDYRLIKEDFDLAEDIHLFVQNGHTPGVIGLCLETKNNGTFLFCSDACYSPLNFGPPAVLPGLVTDQEAYLKNIERLREMQKQYQAQIVFAHDCADYAKWNKSPYLYN